MAFSKLKAHARKAAECTLEDLCKTIAHIFETFQPRDAVTASMQPVMIQSNRMVFHGEPCRAIVIGIICQ